MLTRSQYIKQVAAIKRMHFYFFNFEFKSRKKVKLCPRQRRGQTVAQANSSLLSGFAICWQNNTPPVGLEPTIFGLEVRRLVH
jgi:hypothetical protein